MISCVPYQNTSGSGDESCCFQLIECDKHVSMEFRNPVELDTNLNSFEVLEYRAPNSDPHSKALAGLTLRVIPSSLVTNDRSDAERTVAPSFLMITDDEWDTIALGLNKTPVYVDKEIVGKPHSFDNLDGETGKTFTDKGRVSRHDGSSNRFMRQTLAVLNMLT